MHRDVNSWRATPHLQTCCTTSYVEGCRPPEGTSRAACVVNPLAAVTPSAECRAAISAVLTLFSTHRSFVEGMLSRFTLEVFADEADDQQPLTPHELYSVAAICSQLCMVRRAFVACNSAAGTESICSLGQAKQL